MRKIWVSGSGQPPHAGEMDRDHNDIAIIVTAFSSGFKAPEQRLRIDEADAITDCPANSMGALFDDDRHGITRLCETTGPDR
jgi:hypothetical protein